MSRLLPRLRFWRDHRWAARQMSAYLDDEMKPAGHRRMEHHLRECRRCRALLTTLRSIIHGLRELGDRGSRDAGLRIAAGVQARLSWPPS